MTISTIGTIGADLARIQEKQNREVSERAAAQRAATEAPAKASDALTAVDETTARKLSEIENQNAAASVLTEADVDAQPSPQERVQSQARESIAAQTNKLPPNILQLLNE